MTTALALVACGGGAPDGSGTPGDGNGEVAVGDDALLVVGTDDLRFEPDELRSRTGTIEVALRCEDAINHNLVIIATGGEVAACTPGETDTGSVELDPGTHAFVCTVPGHSSTMRGELVVG